MNFKATIIGAVFGFSLAVIPGCGPAKCATGCTDTTSTCRAGTDSAFCGTKGAACVACASTQSCVSGVCTATTSTGGGTASTGGGSSATGGGTATTGGGTANTGGGSASTGGGTATTGGGSAAGGGTGTGGGSTTCTLDGQECGTGSACMVAELTQTGVRTQCFAGDCDLVLQNCGNNQACEYAAPTPNGTPVRSCVAAGTVGKGAACSQTSRCQAGLTCVGNQLADGGTALTCEKYCYKNSDCLSTELCAGPITVPGSAEIPLTCTPKPPTCDPLVQSTCGQNQGCYTTQSGTVCLPAGTTAAGGTCNAVNGCVAGANCTGVRMQDGGTSQLCLTSCNLDGGMPSCTNAVCRPTNGPTGVCF